MDYEEINRIRTQYMAGQWPQFLESISINGLRGWTGQTINFPFPVVAIVGENGTGKSTILKCAACGYENANLSTRFYASSFFIETHWDHISGVVINYRVKMGNEVRNYRITKATERWRASENMPKRNVYFMDISRTLPLDASVGYAKVARQAAAEVSTTQIETDLRTRLSHILGRDYRNARFTVSDADANRDVGILEREWGELSQFHQGAGEDATLDFIRIIQGIPEYSLLIIDEVEASLHPRAQRRLTRFLLWLSRYKRVQVIISTHSPYILEELPLEARMLLLPGPSGTSVVQGVSAELAMTRIDEAQHPEAYIFVEDREARILLREIIASSPCADEIFPRIEIIPVGPVNVVQLLGKLSAANRLPYRSISVIDGGEILAEGCISLPGSVAPERLVYGDLKQKSWLNIPERFGIGAGTIIQLLEDAMLDLDHHKWCTYVGNGTHRSASSVWEILANEWVRQCIQETDRNGIINGIINGITNIFE